MATPGGVTAPDNPPAPPSDPAPAEGPAADGTGGLLTGNDGLPLPQIPGEKAKLIKSGINKGLAVAPQQAPPEVKAIIAAANRIALFKKYPYRYGGGHRSFTDSAYDCSGTASYALRGANLVSSPLPSGSYMKWGEKGYGRWVTVFAHPGHMYLVIAGLRYDTSGTTDGTRWDAQKRSPAGYQIRFPDAPWNI